MLGENELSGTKSSVVVNPKYAIGDVVFYLDGKVLSEKITGIKTFIGTIKMPSGKTISSENGDVEYYLDNGLKIGESHCFETKKQLIDTL
jgi:hypothetical protein